MSSLSRYIDNLTADTDRAALLRRRLVVALCVVLIAAWWAVHGPGEMADTPSYIDAWRNSLSHGRLDTFRTPLYPTFYGMCQAVGGSHAFALMALLQGIVVTMSALALLAIVIRLTASRLIALIATATYLVYPPVMRAVMEMGTESLAMSMTIAWVWLVIRIYDTRRWQYALWLTLLMLAMVALRPSLLVMVVATGVMTVVSLASKRLRFSALLLGAPCIFVAMAAGFYALRIERITGVRQLSIVSTINAYHIARNTGEIFPDLLEHQPDIIAVMERYNARREQCDAEEAVMLMWEESEYMEYNVGIRAMQDYCDGVARHHRAFLINRLGHRIVESCFGKLYRKNIIYYAIALAYTAIAVAAMWRRRSILPAPTALSLVALGSIAMVLLLAQMSWTRLLLPIVPVLVIMAAQLARCLSSHPLRFHLNRFDK